MGRGRDRHCEGSVSVGTGNTSNGLRDESSRASEVVWRYLGMLAMASQYGVAPDPDELNRLESAFVGVAADYSLRRDVSRDAWLEAGVPPEVLDRAGITW